MNNNDESEKIAAILESRGDYRVLRRLDPEREYPALEGSTVARGVIVDTETTGTDSTVDALLEIGLVAFEYDRQSGTVGRVLDRYDGLEDPGVPIPPESTAIHGITDAMVQGQRFDDAAVARLLQGAALIVAHNARFDRMFLEPRYAAFATLPWACSWQEIPWQDHGIGSSKLEYLAYRSGFFYDGHRAEIDCLALLEVLRRPLGATGASAFLTLLQSARQPSCRLWALNSPFETKGVLRERGYRWDAEKRCWWTEVPHSRLDPELAWLREKVYAGRSVPVEIEGFDATTRYSGREGRRERVRT
jgi:DNA polymerase-3 subunit epsilon